MEQVRYDVIVVGAGPAGVTAAAAVARSGASVLLLEAGAYAGAENWSGCVYFAESLTDPEAFGPDAMDGAPFERRVVRRGFFMTDGEDLVGASHTGFDTFKNCYTVLRPAFDPYWAEQARALGATYLTDTTVTSLIRRDGRVVGVHTNHGPAYAEVVFLAEGDASHLIRYENLERVDRPGFMQGVKAVYSMPEGAIEERFRVGAGEGAANEYLVRNASRGGRTLDLNMAAFLYTNRTTLSVGYVAPLDNLKAHFKGNHEDLLAYVTGLPGIAEHLEGAELSAFGAKLIRTGGVTQSPILVADGLAVGGSACGLGIDVPYPNFTGPAAATGLYFARAVRELADAGRPFSSRNLSAAYLDRLRRSRYWQDAEYLGQWPAYLEHTRQLFTTSVDLSCAAARYLTEPGPFWNRWWLFGRLLRDHLKPKAMRRISGDLGAMGNALRLDQIASRCCTLKNLKRWAVNSLSLSGGIPGDLDITLKISGQERGVKGLPWVLRGVVKRLAPALGRAMAIVYRNGDTPLKSRLEEAAQGMITGVRLLDLLLLGVIGVAAAVTALITAGVDLFRYLVLKVPAREMLDNRIDNDNRRLKERRALEMTGSRPGMAERLATNTYLEGTQSHIRLLWPQAVNHHGDLAGAPYWSVCPAGVYAYEPALSGHGAASVSFENCIKCESCWQSEPGQVRWGRHTDHQLIYRPETPALDWRAAAPEHGPNRPRIRPVEALPKEVLGAVNGLGRMEERARRGLIAFQVAVNNLPAASDVTRTDWPVRVGEAAAHRLHALGAALTEARVGLAPLTMGMPESPFTALSAALTQETEPFALHLKTGDLFEAVSASRRLAETVLDELRAVLGQPAAPAPVMVPCPDPVAASPRETALREVYDDPTVKGWDRNGLDDDGASRLREDCRALTPPGADDPLPQDTLDTVRALSAIHPGLGLAALAHVAARMVTEGDGAWIDGAPLTLAPGERGTRVTGTLHLVPAVVAEHLVISHHGFSHRIPLDGEGVTRRQVRAGGMHPARFETIDLDLFVPEDAIAPLPDLFAAFTAHGYGAIGLGAADYLSRRAVEQAEGRIQFPGQMQDTAGRDGIAKFGAVKALVARTLAWRQLLERLVGDPSSGAGRTELVAALAAMAFSPKDGRMGYDAGQVFGGTGYSEDDLLSRFYRDSAVFPHLAPGADAPLRLAAEWKGDASSLPLAARLIPEVTDTFTALADGPLSPTVHRWQAMAAQIDALDLASGPAREALALTLGIFHLLAATETRLEGGTPVEGEAAALDTLMGVLEDLIAQAHEEQAGTPPFAIAHFPELPNEIEAEPLALDYDAIVHTDDPYASGDYLRGQGTQPRFIPEIQLHDPKLRALWSQNYEWFLEHCDQDPDTGGPYEHYIERLHKIPPEMLKGFQDNGFFASVVPSELDGLGWQKIGYYLLVSGAMRFGDASLSLLIMASTSIGTTPALLSLDKEIPLVDKELGGLVGDDRIGAIQTALDAIVAGLERPDPGKLEKDFKALVAQVEETIRRTKVVKYLAQNFLKTFYTAALAGQRKDFAGFTEGLKTAQGQLTELPATLKAALAELPRRSRAAQAFLRNLGHQGVAAFALTEPTAGSDSGGVATTGHIKRVPFTPLADGRFRFEIDGRQRFLIDADRIEYSDDGMAYRLQSGELAPISHAGYDYATDRGTRTVHVLGDDLPFHDVAQIREDGMYVYYELSGAKMWITNGRVCTQFSMYVKTDEGITGIMVDRHAEGLTVGRDEEKMGQQGSPTNELAIDRVRVPRENVIGYEGHGQVNALETLNVGRCGLAVAGVVMTRRLLVEATQHLPQTDARDRVLAEVAARVFSSESLAFHLVGRFDNKSTTSVRLESAVAKYVCSELLHEGLDKVDALWGAPGQTRDLLLEKMRRDARILNIYEGTNEVQRFLILRELCGMVKGWDKVETADGNGRHTAAARWKETLRKAVDEAVETLGDAVWQDAAMQPAFFPLAEMAGELYLLDTTLYRLDWLAEHRPVLGDDYVDSTTAVGERAVNQCLARLQRMYARYGRGRGAALDSRYPVETVASDAMMETHVAAAPPAPRLGAGTTLTCLLRPVAVTAPQPRLDGAARLTERVWHIHPADEHALAAALALRARAAATVRVGVIAVGGGAGEEQLRRALGAGADDALLLDLPATASPADWADALAGQGQIDKADLILTGADAEGDAPVSAFLSGRLDRELILAHGLSVTGDRGTVIDTDGTPLGGGAVVVLSGNGRIRPTLSGLARAAGRTIPRVEVAAPPPTPTYARLAAAADSGEVATTVEAAAEMIGHFAETARRLAAPAYDGEWEKHPLRTGDGVWAVAEAHEAHAAPAFRAARELGDALGLPVHAVALGAEDGIRGLAGAARAAGIERCYGIDTGGVALSRSGREALIKDLVGNADENGTPVHMVAPEGWENALGRTAGALSLAPVVAAGTATIGTTEDGLALGTQAYGGRLTLRQDVPAGTPAWITVPGTAAFTGGDPVDGFTLARPGERRWRKADLDPDFRIPEPDLKTAEVIVDLGLGVGTPEGMALGAGLMDALRGHGLSPYLGATRKITQGLGLQPQERQIGQTGVTVNPKLIICLGISGAPQHVDYLGGRAQVIAINKDPDAPIMVLEKPGCTVHPVVADAYEAVPALIAALEGVARATA